MRTVRLSRSRFYLPDPLPGTVVIRASVGAGGVNRRDDLRAIQIALNAVPIIAAGPAPQLKVDGLFGPKTHNAILNFQARWVPRFRDGRCDPRGPTLWLLNRLCGVGEFLPPGTRLPVMPENSRFRVAGGAFERAPQPASKPVAVTAEEMARIEAATIRFHMIERFRLPEARRWLIQALRVINDSRRHAEALQGGYVPPPLALAAPERRAFLLVAKHFHLSERREEMGLALAAIAQIENIYRRSMVIISEHIPFRSMEQEANFGLRFICTFGVRAGMNPRALAYAPIMGGHGAPGMQPAANPFIDPRSVLMEKVQRIYVTPNFDPLSANEQVMTIIHEMAHYTGDVEGTGAIDDKAYLYETHYSSLPRALRLINAETYAALAMELAVGAVKMMGDLRLSTVSFGGCPSVAAEGAAEPRIVFLRPGQPFFKDLTFPVSFP